MNNWRPLPGCGPGVEHSRSALRASQSFNVQLESALLGSLAQWWAWGLVTPLIFWTDARLRFKEKQLGMRILAQFLLSLALTTLYLYVLQQYARFGPGLWRRIERDRPPLRSIP